MDIGGAANPNVQPGLQQVDDDDNMYEDVDEDEKTLQEALALSRVPDKKPEEEKKEQPKPEAPQ